MTEGAMRLNRMSTVAGEEREAVRRDDHLILIFDGDCAFCRKCLAVGRATLPYLPTTRAWQSVDLPAFGLTQAEATASVQLVGPAGLHAQGARAIAVLLALQPDPLWRTAGRIMLIPPVSWLAETVYRVVARNRHRLPVACGPRLTGLPGVRAAVGDLTGSPVEPGGPRLWDRQ